MAIIFEEQFVVKRVFKVIIECNFKTALLIMLLRKKLVYALSQF